ncbi:hypothetical protein B296_00000620 [Ensete ventricosum]|uniref:Uncharacterized protein n=1 Tax=Ensete ventricosum TaxID=4639 RepID=A0A427AQV5_ENSVE|nr:hypothetical protein B296_00000620 [Ensete ventricosum]
METTSGERQREEGSSSSLPTKRNDDGIENRGGLIKIPSYQEVLGTANSSFPKPHNRYPSFSQVFFAKSSEFYTPPLPPLPSPTSAAVDRPLSSTPPSSSSSGAASSSYSSVSASGQNRNAILVSHRQVRAFLFFGSENFLLFRVSLLLQHRS